MDSDQRFDERRSFDPLLDDGMLFSRLRRSSESSESSSPEPLPPGAGMLGAKKPLISDPLFGKFPGISCSGWREPRARSRASLSAPAFSKSSDDSLGKKLVRKLDSGLEMMGCLFVKLSRM